MGVLPVPNEIRGMLREINELVEVVKTQNSLLEKIHSLMGASLSSAEQLRLLSDKFDAMHGTLTVATDTLKLLSEFKEERTG